MSKILCIGLILLTALSGWAQEHAWVYFKDKADSDSYFETPLLMLSQKSLDRREKQQIGLDLADVPITQSYIQTLIANPAIAVKAKSKWFNAVHVIGSRTEISNLTSLSFVDRVVFAAKSPVSQPQKQQSTADKFKALPSFNYGGSANQIQMIALDELHRQDFTGTDMTIAVLDGGFPNVNVYSAFQRLRAEGHILGGYDFVGRSPNFYTGISHGTSVLSIMGGFVDGSLIGSAPDADYYLFITEDGASETPLEESLWVEAAEKADSLGVDIINTSLGYSTFDDSRYNYSYNDMDGQTTFITRGADMAFSRGMIIVNSAGNEGNKSWHYITAPADGINVLTVGAVDGLEISTNFSSFGPSADGRIKPDITAKGGGTTVVNSGGAVSTGSGTSYSSPVIAGAVACLWQAYPTKTNKEIINMVKASGDLFATPHAQKGFGVPDFKLALASLTVQDEARPTLRIFPNPVREELFFTIDSALGAEVTIFDVLGRKILSKRMPQREAKISVAQLVPGIYLIQVNQSKFQKFIKH